MTTFIKTKRKKSDYQKNNVKYRVQLNILQNIILYQNLSSEDSSFQKNDDKAIISRKNYVIILKINIFRMEVRTFCYNYGVATLS